MYIFHQGAQLDFFLIPHMTSQLLFGRADCPFFKMCFVLFLRSDPDSCPIDIDRLARTDCSRLTDSKCFQNN